MTRHHRKSISHGGNDEPSNISIVSCKKHEAWHILFGHNEANIISILLNEYFLEKYVVSEKYLFSKKTTNKSNITYNYLSKRKSKREKRLKLLLKSWDILFEGKSELEIIKEINTVWIDPEYTLRVIYTK